MNCFTLVCVCVSVKPSCVVDIVNNLVKLIQFKPMKPSNIDEINGSHGNGSSLQVLY